VNCCNVFKTAIVRTKLFMLELKKNRSGQFRMFLEVQTLVISDSKLVD